MINQALSAGNPASGTVSQKNLYRTTSRIAFLFAMLFHAAQIPLFALIDVPFMAFFNIGSVTLFLILFHASRKGFSPVLISLGWLEVIIHQYSATYFIGNDAGYQHLILFCIMLPIFSPRGNAGWKWTFVAAALGFYLYLAIGSSQWAPQVILEPKIINVIFGINIFLVGANLMLMGWGFNNNVLLFQEKLLEQTEKISTLLSEVQYKNEEIIEANRSLIKMDSLKSDFVSTVSHELRTPLTSIIGFAKIIYRKYTEQLFPKLIHHDEKIEKSALQVSENLKIIISEGERLTNLINDVLDLAKMEAGKIEWKADPVRPETIIQRAIDATSSLFSKKEILCKSEIEQDLPHLIADEDRLIQVMINLLSNAIKFTEKGSVLCHAKLSETGIVFSVTDTGDGIASDNLASVFEKFKQVGDVLSDKPKGTGLGLPICKEIIEHHGGKIWVESELEKGSTFFFEIPVLQVNERLRHLQNRKEIVKRVKASVIEEVPIILGKKTVLVIDDEESIRKLIRQELEDVGYSVIEAVDGLDALQILKTVKPDVITLDIMMPTLNGFDLAAILKNDPTTASIPIIIVSVIDDQARGINVGVDRYLSKPIDTNGLVGVVNELTQSVRPNIVSKP